MRKSRFTEAQIASALKQVEERYSAVDGMGCAPVEIPAFVQQGESTGSGTRHGAAAEQRSMLRSTSILLCLASSLTFVEPALGQTFIFDLRCRDVSGPVGSVQRVGVDLILEAPVGGISGFSISLRAYSNDGLDFTLGADPCPPECAAERLGLETDGVFFHPAHIVDPDHSPTVGPLAGAPQGQGFVSAAALNPLKNFVLGSGSFLFGRLYVDVTIPPEETGRSVTVEFLDGMQCACEPVSNAVTFDNASWRPQLRSCTIRAVRGVARFRRGDVDGSGLIDITDAVNSLRHQFLGLEVGCADAVDLDDNGMKEISDVIGSLTFQFLAGTPPAPPGKDVCGEDPTEDELDCVQYPRLVPRGIACQTE